MNIRVSLAVVVTATLLSASSLLSAADRQQMKGDELFTYHGCVNCHGAEGKNPTSKLVPKIGGMAADEVLTKSMKILKGETDSEQAKLMKSAVAYSQSCDSPPSDAELEKIAIWLATRQ